MLIVDDNLTNRQILEEWLRNWRMCPVAVGDAGAAVAALRHADENGTPFSLVLLDGRMPNVDGLTLAAQVRERSDISSIPIILLTSDDAAINTARSREMGICAHLVKPVQQSELLETISHVMCRRIADAPPTSDARSPADAEPRPVPAVPLNILVAEDNEFNVTLLTQLFDQKGHRAQIAADGREALALAMAERFDALLLDIHLPEMDGFAVAHAIREHERGSGKHLPIVAFTARSGKQDRQRCLDAGMDDFVSKPVQADALWAVIDRVVADPAQPDGDDMGLLDPPVLLAACGGDPAILEKICEALRARLPDQLQDIDLALQARDAPRLREAAHKLSGVVAAFSSKAGAVASEIEDRAAQGQLEEAETFVSQLATMANKLMPLTVGLSIDRLRQSNDVDPAGR